MFRLFQALFWAAILFAFVMAMLPQPPAMPGTPSDKLQHLAAFFTLAVLARLGFPDRIHLQVLGGLALFGALIEFSQMLPIVGRDGDVGDWLADVAGATLGLLALGAGRRLLARS